ncbi:protein mitoshell isoform X1 [Drosophila navojoa]|uniref:protein mitoshell isoform X1 n=1 Tax=Drosophila navojoa TaxID=7232 RepID=UPI0011BF76E4|nr:protein mitoshell isoform X1 [Drosophila navojoa]XP_030242411.1 protein mitoshell isoform X1 [Drosophila navojoa]
MSSGYNAPLYHIPVAVESLCQQSMYQQHTYVDRTRMAITDVFVQEHVSQSSWTMSTPPIPIRPPVFIQTGRGHYMGGNAAPPPAAPHPPPPPPPSPHRPSMHGRFTYMSMPGVQYYAASSASMSSFGQMYMQHSATASANMGGMYVPQYNTTYSTPRPHHQTKDNACQTRIFVKRSCDAATQTDLIGDAPPIVKFKYQANLSDSSKESSTSRSSCESNDCFPGILQGERRNSEIILPMQRLQDITRISLNGSDIAERLANAHRQRPCFKKMDTLCARLKQDLLRPDSVLPNINSQGIAWAVKDFIFVFTRIVNSWVILKGYVYNTPDGLNKIKDELPSGFMAAFDNWQLSTLTIVEMIIKSFVNLDGMLQKQKNSFCKLDISNNCNSSGNGSSNGIDNSSDSNSSNKTLNGTEPPLPLNTTLHLTNDNLRGPSAFSTPYNSMKSDHTVKSEDTIDNSCNEPPMPPQEPPPRMGGRSKSDLNYLYTMIQDSEEAQRCVNANGTYLKTGTYTPLKKDANASPPPQNVPNSWRSTAQPLYARQQAQQQYQQQQQNQNQRHHQQYQQSVPFEQLKSALKCQTPKLKTPQCRHTDAKPYATLMGREMSRRLYELSNRIMQLQNIDRFFQKQFTRNYYPYFFERCQHEFIDVRAIILKCESATYQHIYQAIHDMRRIIYLVRSDLKDHTNMDLRLYTALYERSINEMLAKTPYHPKQFEHITGEPGEKLFN